mgnify:CR=1 FL=1
MFTSQVKIKNDEGKGIPKTPKEIELEGVKESLRETDPVGPLVEIAKTVDQVGMNFILCTLDLSLFQERSFFFFFFFFFFFLFFFFFFFFFFHLAFSLSPTYQARTIMTCLEAVSEKNLRTTVAVTASRGRGKSAAMGLSMAGWGGSLYVV